MEFAMGRSEEPVGNATEECKTAARRWLTNVQLGRGIGKGAMIIHEHAFRIKPMPPDRSFREGGFLVDERNDSASLSAQWL